MSIKISDYTFEGPFKYISSLDKKSGVYTILTPTTNSKYKVLDVGESANVRERVENHDRESCWKRNANSEGLRYAAHYVTSEVSRKKIEKKVQGDYDPPCGKK